MEKMQGPLTYKENNSKGFYSIELKNAPAAQCGGGVGTRVLTLESLALLDIDNLRGAGRSSNTRSSGADTSSQDRGGREQAASRQGKPATSTALVARRLRFLWISKLLSLMKHTYDRQNEWFHFLKSYIFSVTFKVCNYKSILIISIHI